MYLNRSILTANLQSKSSNHTALAASPLTALSISVAARTPFTDRLPERPVLAVADADAGKFRMRFDGLKNHRRRLGLSAADFGKLIGVSALTVYNWEAGKAKLRRKHLPHIAHVRELGKRDAASALLQMKHS